MPRRKDLPRRRCDPKTAAVSKKLKNIGVISLFTVVSRVLGLMRDQVGAAVFGGSVFNDAFLTAFRVPNLFRRLLGEGALTAAFIPTLQEELAERGMPGAFSLLNKVASWLLVITGALVAVAMVALSQARVLAGHEEKWYLAAHLAVLMFPYLLLVCLAAAFNAALNVFQHFTEIALSSVWLNIAMIASLVGAWRHYAGSPLGEVHWLCAGVLIGGFFQMTVPAVSLVRMGWRPRFELVLGPRVRQIGALMAPGLFGTAIYQINTFVSGMLAFSLVEGSATVLFYANRLMELPIGVFAIAVATVIYPLIAKHAVEGNMGAMADDFRRGLRLILAVNIPAAAGLALLAGPIVRTIYRHGEFSAHDAGAMTPLLALFVIGLPFFSINSLTVRAFYAVKDTATPVKIAAIDFLVNLTLSLALRSWLGAAGLVIASTTAIVVQMVLLQRALGRRLPEMTLAPLRRTIAKIVGATLAMSAVVWAGGWGCHALWPGTRVGDLVAVVTMVPLGVAVYGVVLWFAKVEGREEFAALFATMRAKLR